MRNTPLVLCQQQSKIPVPGLESGPESSIRKIQQASTQLEEKKKKKAKGSNIKTMFARCKLIMRLNNKSPNNYNYFYYNHFGTTFFNLFFRPTLAAVKYDVISL